MIKFWTIVGWPLRTFLAGIIYIVGCMTTPDDPNNLKDAKDVYHGRG